MHGQCQMPVCLLQTWTQTTTYLQLVGILLGQVFFGVMGDAVGRRAAMLTDMVRCLWDGYALVCHAPSSCCANCSSRNQSITSKQPIVLFAAL